MKENLVWLQGGVAVTFPAWGQLLTTGWQVLIGGLGFIVLVLTIWNKVLELKQRRKDLREG